jgi:peptidoglycan hydrolase CwlO-like protein
MEASQQPTTARKGSNKGVLIILIIMIGLLSAASGYLVWTYLQSKKAFDGMKVENVSLKDTVTAQNKQLDSLQLQLNGLQGAIPARVADSLNAVIADLQEKIKNTPTRVVYSNGGGGGNKKQIEELKEELAALQAKYDALIKERDALKIKNNQLEQDKTTLSQEKDKLDNTNKNLQDKVDVAAQLKFYDTMLTGYKLDKKGKKTFEEKAKKVMGLEVSFKIQENAVAEEGEKMCYIVIMGPNKKVMAESSANVFQVNGVDKVYSVQKSFYFNNKQALISADYKTGEQLKDGEYTAEIYVEGKLSGTAANYLKK